MANKFQIKRTTVAGRTANTTSAANTSFIDKGELAFNLADRKLYSSDTSNTLFEVGANLTTLSVSSTLTVSGNTTITGDLTVSGNTTLGDAAADSITINGNTITISANSNIDAGTLFVDSLNNRVGIGNTAPANKLFVTGDIGLDGISVRDTATTTTTATTQVTLFEYPVATYDSADIIIKAVTGGERHTTKLLVTANSTVAIATEYGSLTTGSLLYTVDVDVTASNTRIRITPASATSTVFKSSYELITV